MAFKRGIQSVSLVFACGTALFSDGYANGIISSVNTLLIRIYGKAAIEQHSYGTTLRSLAFAGTVVGMLAFGYLSDRVGRKFGMMTATGIVAFFSALSAASSGFHGSVRGLLIMLSACRFLLGIGVGAEYPCGSVAASEQAEEGPNKKARNRWLALATNCMIDFGFVISAFVPLVLYWIFGPKHLRAVWRLSLGLGVIPALAVLLWRLRMVEPERYRKDSMKRTTIPYSLVIRKYWPRLAVVSTTWFIYDFIVYPLGIYSSIIVDNITGGSTALSVVFGWNVVINLFYMPGCIGGAFIVDSLGPRNTMIFALLAQAVVGFIMSGLYTVLTKHIAAFAVAYGIFLTLGEVGPGNCLCLLVTKSAPTAIRGQFYGVAAAIGKVGAFVGTWAFPAMIDAFGGASTVRGNTGPFWVCSGLSIVCAMLTYLLKPIEEDVMIKEDLEFRAYLEANGNDTSMMGLDDRSDAGSAEKGEEKDVTMA